MILLFSFHIQYRADTSQRLMHPEIKIIALENLEDQGVWCMASNDGGVKWGTGRQCLSNAGSWHTELKLLNFFLFFEHTTMKDLERSISEHIEATRCGKDGIETRAK